jgi:GT2 family glycosyltransferase
VIPTHDREFKLARLLDSIAANDYPSSRYEVIVVADHCSDGTLATLAADYPHVRVVQMGELRFSGWARQLGYEAARGEYLFFVDDDNVLEPGCMTALVRALELYPQLGVVGPLMYSDPELTRLWCAGAVFGLTGRVEYRVRGHRRIDRECPALTTECDFLPNAYCVRRQVLLDAPFDPATFPSAAFEADYALRAKQCGWQVRCSTVARTWHDSGYRSHTTRLGLPQGSAAEKGSARGRLHRRFTAGPVRNCIFWLVFLPVALGYYGARSLRRGRDAPYLPAYLSGVLRAVLSPAPAAPPSSPRGPAGSAMTAGADGGQVRARVGVGGPLVSLVIPTHDRRDKLLRLLASVDEPALDGVLELIVVTDVCVDDTAAAVRQEFPHVVLLEERATNLWRNGARRLGAGVARGRYVFFVDDDNVLEPGCVSALVEDMSRYADVGVLGPVSYHYPRSRGVWCAGAVLTKLGIVDYRATGAVPASEWRPGLLAACDYLPNAYMVRAEVLAEVPLDDEAFPHNWAELDFCLRARAKGWATTVSPRAAVLHDVGYSGLSTRLTASTVRDVARSRVLIRNVLRPWTPVRERLLFWLVTFPIGTGHYLARLGLRRARCQLLALFVGGTREGFSRSQRSGGARLLPDQDGTRVASGVEATLAGRGVSVQQGAPEER